jgi:hypothetical protein
MHYIPKPINVVKALIVPQGFIAFSKSLNLMPGAELIVEENADVKVVE